MMLLHDSCSLLILTHELTDYPTQQSHNGTPQNIPKHHCLLRLWSPYNAWLLWPVSMQSLKGIVRHDMLLSLSQGVVVVYYTFAVSHHVSCLYCLTTLVLYNRPKCISMIWVAQCWVSPLMIFYYLLHNFQLVLDFVSQPQSSPN
jgi:hypothetical protein